MSVADYPDDWNPSQVLIGALAAKANGEAFDEDEAYDATMVLAVGALVSRGIPIDLAKRAVLQASDHGTIRVRFDGEALDVSIGESDGQ